MQWRILNHEELSVLFLTDLERDFPAGELRPQGGLPAMCREGTYRPWAVFDVPEGAPTTFPSLCAYMLVAAPEEEGPVLLDYFGVRPAYRERGLGAELLAELSAREGRPVLIESEWPASAPDPALARRRLRFYARCGAVDTPWCDRAFGSWFKVLLLPVPGIPADHDAREESGPQLAYIYRWLLPEETYPQDFELRRI